MTWRTFDHQADLGIEIDAPDGATLFAEAALAFFATVCEFENVEERERYELAGEANRVENLLVDWLNDLVFLLEVERVVCRRVEFREWQPTRYGADLYGEPANPERHELHDLIKAATYHGLVVRQHEDGWHARVILDV
jgi:SHS2 domain-containing protein